MILIPGIPAPGAVLPWFTLTFVPEPVRTLADIVAQFAGVAAARLIAGF